MEIVAEMLGICEQVCLDQWCLKN